jgi:hypothetical protein
VLHIDTLGNTVWQHTFDGGFKDAPIQVVLLPNSNEIIALQWQATAPKLAPSYLNSVFGHVKAYRINWQTHQIMASNYINSGVEGYTGKPIAIDNKIIYRYFSKSTTNWNNHEGIGVASISLDSLYYTDYSPITEAPSNPNSIQLYNTYDVSITSGKNIITAGWFYTPPTPVLFPQGGQYGWLMRLDSMGCFIDNCWVGTTESPPLMPQIQVFPNPAHSFLTIIAPLQKGTIFLYNTLGQLQHQQTISDSQTQIDIYAIPNGLYFISVYDANGQRVGSECVVVQYE